MPERVMGSNYRWVIVAAGGLLGCVAIGAMFSLPVFLVPLSASTGWSRTGISSAMTIGFLTMAVGLAGASRAQTLWQFQLVFGLLVGLSAASVLAPMMAAVTGWFETRRSLAVSLVSAGMGMAPMTMAPLAAWLIGRLDWREAFL